MAQKTAPPPSARKLELLESAYAYSLTHGLGDLSLRPLASAIGSSPRVLLFLFGSKDGLIQALLGRAREDEVAMLDTLRRSFPDIDLRGAVFEVWRWLSDPAHRNVLVLWVEGYGRSLVDPAGPWANFAQLSVADWLDLLASYQPARARATAAARAERTAALAVLRGALLDLLATGDERRVGAGVRSQFGTDGPGSPRRRRPRSVETASPRAR